MQFIDIVYAAESPSQEGIVETASQTGGVLGSLGINGQLFIFQLINFAVVAAILWFMILKPLTQKMNERKKIIDESLDKAKEIDANLIMAEEKFKEKLEAAKEEANKILEKAGSESKQLADNIKEQAKKEIEVLAKQAKVKIKEEREDAISLIKKDAGELIAAALEKILQEKVDVKKDKEVIEKMVKTIKLGE